MPRKLILVDGSNQAFRAFFAIQNDMRAPDGFPTRALFGFANVLRKLVRQYQPDGMAVVFDVGKSFRNELYPDYKGQRPDMPDELRQQWPELAPLCEAFGVRAIAINGLEADDIIGTLAVRYAGPDTLVDIVSSDKDFCQLVSPHVRVLDVANDRELDPAGVLEKWGVGPDKIIDLLSLMGDTSDNVPGVPGVGEKTAAKYINQYGSLDGVLANAATIGGKTGARIAESKDIVALARQLVTLKTDLPLDYPWSSLALRGPDPDVLRERLTRYNFKRMLTELGLDLAAPTAPDTAEGAAPTPSVERGNYRTINTPEDLGWLVAQLRAAGRFAYDSETTALDPLRARFVGMSFAWDASFGVYVPIGHEDGPNCPGALEALTPLLADPTLKKTGQNLKYDLEVLRANGYDLAGIDGDTMLADYLIDVEQKHNLDDMARRLLGHQMISFAETAGPYGDQFAKVPVEKATQYAAEDAHVAFLLDRMLDVGDSARVYREIELPLIPVLADMELAGIGIDTAALEKLSVEFERRIQDMVAGIYKEAGETFNINSTQQLATLLFDKRGLPKGKKTKFGYSTDAETLQNLADTTADPLPGLIINYRELAKLKSTYVDALPRSIGVDGRIHTSYHQAVAATGRLSSNDPNLQNIPIRSDEGRRIRECFVAKPGHRFVSADYSQIELRILAHFCGEGPLVEAFRNGEDIHRRTAAEIFGVAPALVSGEQRRAAKAINFGLIYGMSAFRLAREINVSRGEAQRYMDNYFARYPQVRAYMARSIDEARATGYAVTRWGRRRPVRQLNSSNPNERGGAERVAMNTPIQGSAADLIKAAMLRVDARIRRDFPASRLLLQVHDELILEVPEADVAAVQVAVAEEMQATDTLAVPLVADTGSGRTWGEAH